ncbi:methyl-accepting chemotaxis protein [Neobacillus jeddahensis]|uniref:methyl-accepting chemotaxis protein n=1 Tax=Neobacillus jeddahensis TaxID=1461580 RepID=UPI0005907829|nr:methyl-accepting chemotaxis protein [Neobacillus jeddahensis]
MTELKSNKKGLSIRIKWILFICISILLAVSASFAFNYFTVSKILKQDDADLNKINAIHAAEQVNLNLNTYKTSIEQFATLVSNDISSKDAIPRIQSLIQSYKEKNNTLIAVYYMDFTTGKLHIAPYADMDLDVRTTRTYKQLNQNPETQWMDVYKDTQSNKIMTSIVTPIMSNGKMVGALGYDIDLSSISTIREEIESQSNAKLVILDAHGFIVSSFIKNANGKNINPAQSGSVEGVEDLISDNQKLKSVFGWVEDVYKSSDLTSHMLTWDEKDYSGEISTIQDLNWKVMSFTPTEIFAKKINDFNWTGLYSILLGLLIGILCSIFLAEKLKKIITTLLRVIEKTADGDLVTTVDIKANDEIGHLTENYNKMLQNMNNLIKKVSGNVNSIDQATGNLSVISNEHKIAISEVSKAIGEIATGVGTQSEQIIKGSNAISELGEEVEELSKQSTIIEKELDEASERISTGNQQVVNLEESYQSLEKAFQRVTEMMSKLNEKSKSISNVSNSIGQIAEQTNLLALNASIEAARAGEHGRGFSVVADEVRKLAEESKKATQDIQSIINSILSDTIELVDVMGDTNQINKNQKSAVTTVSSSINQLTESLNKIMTSIKQETTSINTLQGQKDVVLRMIDEISAISQQTSAAAEEIAAAMEEQSASTTMVAQHTTNLSELVDDLKTAVGKFTIDK